MSTIDHFEAVVRIVGILTVEERWQRVKRRQAIASLRTAVRKLTQSAGEGQIGGSSRRKVGATHLIKSLPWEAIGAVAGVVGALLAALQIPVWRRKKSKRHAPYTAGSTNPAPLGKLQSFRDRIELLGELSISVRRGGQVHVLTGLGGVGKSSIGLALVRGLQEKQRRKTRKTRVWWIPAGDLVSLTSAMVYLVQEIGGSRDDQRLIEQMSPAAPPRFWALLRRLDERWLLVFDNADDPSVLASPTTGSTTSDGTGWLQAATRGTVIVTSRHSSPTTWGKNSRIHPVQPLDNADAAAVLLDYAADAGDAESAEALAATLGGLPLALKLAGSALNSKFSQWKSFRAYQADLESYGSSLLKLGPHQQNSGDPRAAIALTWELSLNQLETNTPFSRPVHRLLCCFAPAIPIPISLLAESAFSLTPLKVPGSTAPDREFSITSALAALSEHGLIEAVQTRRPWQQDILIHTLVAHTGRHHLMAGENSSASEVYQTAIQLIVHAMARVETDDPKSWPLIRAIIPHMSELVNAKQWPTVESIDAAVQTVARMVEFLLWSGAITIARELGARTLEKVPVAGSNPALKIALQSSVAMAEGELGDWRLAESLLKSAVHEANQLVTPDEVELLRLRQQFAYALRENGSYKSAEMEFDQIATRRAEILGAEHYLTQDSRHERARTLRLMRRNADALRIFEDLAARRTTIFGAEHPRTLASRHEYAVELRIVGRLQEALVEIEQVLEIRTRVLGNRHPGTLDSAQELAAILGELGNATIAAEQMEHVRSWFAETLGSGHRRTIAVAKDLARIHLLANEVTTALEEYRLVLAAQRQALGVAHPETRRTEREVRKIRRSVATS